MLVITFDQVMLDDINEKHDQANALLELPPSQSADWDPGSFVTEKRKRKQEALRSPIFFERTL